MKKINLVTGLAGLVFAVALPLRGLANDGNPVGHLKFSYTIVAPLLTDSLPATAAKTGDAPDDVIKEVPKARKQPIPVPVSVQVKPIKIIKPKIIKPVIKVLH